MNSGYNPSVFHVPALAMESLCQQSMYQQHTYVDRSHMAVTDVIVQEHVSQSSWSMSSPSVSVPMTVRAPVFVQTGPYISNSAPPPQPQAPPAPTPQSRYAYMSMPGVQYYASSSASMNAYGQMYMQYSSSSANAGGVYVPQSHASQSRAQQQTKDAGIQTQAGVNRSSDASTQTELVGDVPLKGKIRPKSGSNDSSKESNRSKSSSLESHQLSGAVNQGIHQGDRRNSQVTLPMQRLQDITRISLQGSDIAERLANAHRQRPCFKKMDTLCARLKQDLLRPDGVLPNINSQGIAWAVKDFIFVFTRIVNSWVILKGYVYNTPDGLNKIKDKLPAGFMAAFDCWQITTLTLVDMIIKSFVNLDGMLQKQKNSFTHMEAYHNSFPSNGNSSDSNSSNKTLNGTDILLPVTAVVSPQDNLKRSYGPSAHSTPHSGYKCSVITAIGGSGSGAGGGSGVAVGSGKVTSVNILSDSTEADHDSDIMEATPICSHNLSYLYTMIEDSEEAQRCVNANGTYLKTGTYTPLKKDANPTEQQSQQEEIHTPKMIVKSGSQCDSVEPSKLLQKCQIPKTVLRTQCRHNDIRPYTTPLSLGGREMSRKIFELSCRIMQLQNIDRFFQKQFTRNYYPYFFERWHHEFIDVRAIILKCESATYQHIYQPVHDMRRIIYLVRNDLKDHTNMDLRLYTSLYENSINDMLTKLPYLPDYFEHITGRPGEKLYNHEI